jgi:hypothetical protein
MSDFYIGTYWYERQLTLREYADASNAFIMRLMTIHPVFRFVEWVGNLANHAVKLESDLSNLEGLIYAHAENKDFVYEKLNPDGSLSWNSFGAAGYGMGYSAGQSVSGGEVVIRIRAGRTGSTDIANGLSIEFSFRGNSQVPGKELFDYDFLNQLMSLLVAFWKPENGRLTSYAFSKAVAASGSPIVGWLTYVRDPRAAALRNSPSLKKLIFHPTPDGGTLISLGRTPISPDNPEQVENARALRRILIDEGLVAS